MEKLQEGTKGTCVFEVHVESWKTIPTYLGLQVDGHQCLVQGTPVGQVGEDLQEDVVDVLHCLLGHHNCWREVTQDQDTSKIYCKFSLCSFMEYILAFVFVLSLETWAEISTFAIYSAILSAAMMSSLWR